MRHWLPAMILATCTSHLLAAAPAPIVLLDEADTIGKWSGVEVATEPVQSGRASARWSGAGRGGVAKLDPAPSDWSRHNVLMFDLHSNTADERQTIIVAVSTEDADAWSYYMYRLKIDWAGWRMVRIPFVKFRIARSPKGWHAIDSLCFYSRGWNIEPLKGSVIQLDNMRLEYSDKLARRQVPKRRKTPRPKLEPWQGKLAFPPFRWDDVFAFAERDKEAGTLLRHMVELAAKRHKRPMVTREFRLADIPERERDGRYKYAGDNAEVFAIAMHDCRNGALLNSYMAPMALAARHAGKPEYLAWVVRQLREVATWSPLQRPGWTQYNPKAKMPPGGDGNWLATGYSMRAIVHTLTLVGDRLPDDLRGQLRELLQKEIDSIQDDWRSKRPWFVRSDYPATNQWVLPNAAMIYACLYLGDERNRAAYEMGVHNLARTCLAQGADGSWSEGLGYGMMSAEYLFWAAWALERNGDHRLIEYGFPSHFADWIIHMILPGRFCVNAFDCGMYRFGGRPHNSFMLSALLVDKPEAYWAGEHLFDRVPSSLAGLLFRYYSAKREGELTEPKLHAFFPHQQVLTWRSGWGEKEAMGLWIRGGSVRDSHSHRDNGHISVYNGREPVLIEAGTCSYADRDLPIKYSPAAGHSIFQVDEVTPSGRGCHAPLTIERMDERGGKATIDGTNAFNTTAEWIRTVEWRATGAVTLTDRVELMGDTDADTEYFRFHTASAKPLAMSGAGKKWAASWGAAAMTFVADRDIAMDQVNWPDRSGIGGHACMRIRPAAAGHKLQLTTALRFARCKPKDAHSPGRAEYERAHASAAPGRDMHVLQAEDMTGGDKRFTLSDKKVGAKRCIYNWNDVGQTLTAEIDVKSAGWYRVLIKCCTGANQGIPVRSIAIDGKVPFKAAAAMVFPDTGGWSNATDNWELRVLGQDASPPCFRFFLASGKRRLALTNEDGGGLNVDYIVVYPADMGKDDVVKPVEPARPRATTGVR